MPSSKSNEANRLYWETDESVAGIAEQLELSRRALYEAVQPLPAGRDCPDCGEMLVYENRSARNTHRAVCLYCDAEEVEEGEEGAEPETPVSPPEPATIDLSEVWNEDVVRIGGAALAGLAIGSLATLFFVKRR